MQLRLSHIVAVWAAFSGGVVAHAQDAVRLRPAAVIAGEQRVTLADIAIIEGTQAERLGAIVLRERAAAGSVISLADVRAAIGGTQGVNAGRVALSGGDVRLMEPANLAAAAQAAPQTRSEATTQAAAGLRVRDALPAFLAQAYGVKPDELRVTFDESDTDKLATGLTNRTYTFAPQGTSDRPPVHVRVYEGDTLIAAFTTRVRVLVHREVVIARSDLSRGTPIDEATAVRERRWLPLATRVAAPSEVMGRMARSVIRAGSVIESRNTDDAIVVRKGDLVAVDCISGGIVLRSQMRARADGRVGEFVEFAPPATTRSERAQKRGERAQERASVKTIRARIAGPGRAVVVTAPPSDESAGQLREQEQSDARSATEDQGMDAAPSTTTDPAAGQRTIVLPVYPAPDGKGSRP